MSVPVINKSDRPVTREQAITNIIESVALEEAALSSILNAESEKIQRAVCFAKDEKDLLKINASVQSMISTITILQTVLHAKLQLVACEICKGYHGHLDVEDCE